MRYVTVCDRVGVNIGQDTSVIYLELRKHSLLRETTIALFVKTPLYPEVDRI